jgi:hypothetical protein
VAAYFAGGVGVAGVLVGAVAGVAMLSKKSVVSANCTNSANGISLCDNGTGVDAGHSAVTLGLISSVGWGVAVAGLGVGTVLFVTEPSDKPMQRGQLALSVSVSAAGPAVACEGSW